MGCCVSTTPAGRSHKSSGEPSTVSDNNMPPPQPPAIAVEEETVKEVLSETTFLTSSNDEPAIQNNIEKPIIDKIQENDEKPENAHAGEAQDPTRPGYVDPVEDVSEVSEICSLSLNDSVSSTVVNAHEDGDEELKLRQRSPGKPRSRVTGSSNNPTRRSEQSPAKRSVGETGSAVRSVNASSGSGMIYPADRSGRRSRSPATNRPVMSPGPGTGRGGRMKNSESPSRVKLEPGKKVSEQVSQWPSCGVAAGNYNCAPRESLENPLVSLECFIFL